MGAIVYVIPITVFAMEEGSSYYLTWIVFGHIAGVETAGELNNFLRDEVNDYYHNIEPKDISVIIIQSGNRLLPETSEELA